MADGLLKNFEVVGTELKGWYRAMRDEHLPRFKTGTWRLGKQNYLHLLVNVLDESIEALHRTLTYALILWFLWGLGTWLGSLF